MAAIRHVAAATGADEIDLVAAEVEHRIGCRPSTAEAVELAALAEVARVTSTPLAGLIAHRAREGER